MIHSLFDTNRRPTRPSFFVHAIALACLVLGGAPVSGQDPPDDVLKVNTALVQLNVGVVDRRGQSITNLGRHEFAVYEDEVLQPITDFEPTAAPFSLILLLDMSGSTQTFRPTLKQAAYRFLDALAPEDRVAVVAFNKDVEMLANFTTDKRKVAKAIESADGKGETHLYEALKYSLEKLGKEGQRRKAIVMLTDGVDTTNRKLDRAAAANASTNAEALASVKPEASATLNSALRAADAQAVTIYPLALPTGDPKRLSFAAPVQTAIYASARTRMQILADRTGGRLNEIRRLEDLGLIYAGVAADLRTLYTIVYQPKNKNAPAGSWRAIRIEVTRPELIAHTKPGYFGR